MRDDINYSRSTPAPEKPWDPNYVYPTEIEIIHESLFTGCKQLETIVIPGTVKFIDKNAFSRCINLTTFTILLSSMYRVINLKTIGNNAFYGCTSLTEINMSELIPPIVIGESAFAGCTSLKSFWFFVEVININTFLNCKSLTSIDLRMVEEINEFAFKGCENLKTIQLRDTIHLRNINESAFEGCSNLATIELWHSPDASSDNTDTFIPLDYYQDYDDLVHYPEEAARIQKAKNEKAWNLPYQSADFLSPKFQQYVQIRKKEENYSELFNTQLKKKVGGIDNNITVENYGEKEAAIKLSTKEESSCTIL